VTPTAAFRSAVPNPWAAPFGGPLLYPVLMHLLLAVARPLAPLWRARPGTAARLCPGFPISLLKGNPMNVALCSTASQPRIAVVGGSLTGPVVALLLLQAGFDDVAVYESALAAVSRGGGLIGLEHCSLDVLERLGIAQSELVAYPSERIVRMSVQDRCPRDAVTYMYPGRNTTWTLLHQALTARLPGRIVHTGHQVTGMDEVARRPMLHFANGHQAAADVVVFADGRASVGRRLLDPDRRLRYAGYVAHRGTAAAGDVQQPDFLRMEPCPGVQFNIAPVPAGLDWTFYLNASVPEYVDWFGVPPQQRLFVLPQHVSQRARVAVDARAAVLLPPQQAALVQATTVRMAVPVMDIDPPRQMVWPVGDGHAVLLGDALAPVRPHTARGANNGIEQAAGLAVALRQHHRYGADLAAALNGWQRRYLPAAVAAVRLGPVIGGRLGLGTSTTGPVRDAARVAA
jgi:2-polyprenyl-6-methoxyphenol hydroxylase-like FAD-dependent oxidoreductase